MAGSTVSSRPLVPSVRDDIKVPTGEAGDLAISIGQVKAHIISEVPAPDLANVVQYVSQTKDTTEQVTARNNIGAAGNQSLLDFQEQTGQNFNQTNSNVTALDNRLASEVDNRTQADNALQADINKRVRFDVDNQGLSGVQQTNARTNIDAEKTLATGTIAQYIRGDKSLSDFKADVLATALSGLVFTTNAAITATDSILAAFGKLQAQVDKRLRFDASQTLSAAEQTQAKSNLGLPPDLLLTAKQITGTATATNVPSLVLTPDATVFTEAATHVVLASKFDTVNNRGGSLSLQRPDNAATGGNQRGIGSIDMQVSRTAATHVTGNYSLALGRNQTVTGSSIGISNNYAQSVNNAGIALNNLVGTATAGAVTQGIALNCSGVVTNAISLGNSSNVLNGIGIQIPSGDPGFANVSKGIGIGGYVTATNYSFALGLIATATDGSFCISADGNTSIQAMNGSFAMGSGGLTNGKYALSMGRINLNSGYCNGVFGEGITTGNYHNGVYTGGNGAVTKINALSAQIAANSTAVLKFGNGSVQTGYLQEMQSGYEAFIGYVYLEARVGSDNPTAAAYYRVEAAKHNVGGGGLLGTPVITTLGTTDNTVTSLWTLTVTYVSGILRITAGLNNAAGSAKMQVQALG